MKIGDYVKTKNGLIGQIIKCNSIYFILDIDKDNKNDIAILHSRLTVKQKYEEWKRIISGNVKIVVGARSAIFAPIKNLGIIIIDEEHDMSQAPCFKLL